MVMPDYVKRINELEAQLNFSILGGNKLEYDNARLVALNAKLVEACESTVAYFETERTHDGMDKLLNIVHVAIEANAKQEA